MDYKHIPRAARGGVNRVVAILLALIGVMLVIIAIPAWNRYRERAEVIACEQALKTARDGLIIDYLGRFQEGSVQDAMATLDEVMPARPKICPSGGTIYLIRNSKGIYEPYCGLHNPDEKQRVRLNASRAMDLMQESRRTALKWNKVEPESVQIELNSLPLECVRVPKKQLLRRGTATTDGFEGVVACYGVAGDGDWPVTKAAPRGELCYFVYADENHCAIWQAENGWTGDAYSD